MLTMSLSEAVQSGVDWAAFRTSSGSGSPDMLLWPLHLAYSSMICWYVFMEGRTREKDSDSSGNCQICPAASSGLRRLVQFPVETDDDDDEGEEICFAGGNGGGFGTATGVVVVVGRRVLPFVSSAKLSNSFLFFERDEEEESLLNLNLL